jgi:catechol 2,3-dioxygenase-like lactoylglutathione lyase family enzyme
MKQETGPISPRLNHIMLYVSDLERSVDFYTRAFDIEVTDRIEKILVFQDDGSEVKRDVTMAFLKFPGQDFVYELSQQPIDSSWNNQKALFQHVGVDVPDIEIAFTRVAEAGGEVIAPVRNVRAHEIEAKQAFFRGPDGEIVELMQIITGEF